VAPLLDERANNYNRFWIVRMAFAIFEDAVVAAVERRETVIGRECRHWIERINGYDTSTERRWFFRFDEVCQLLNYDEQKIRTAILKMPKGSFKSRGGRGRRGRPAVIGR
jgi:hypothetical protein